jgi:hypothetical protein
VLLGVCLAGTDGGGGPDNWQRWGGKPEFEKVWQMQQPALPKDTRESHGGTARKLAGEERRVQAVQLC